MSYGRFRGPLEDADRLQKAAETARLGLVRLQEGNLPQAEYDLYKALMMDPDNARVRGYLGLVLLRMGRLEDAARELQVALSQAPDDGTLRSIEDMVLQGIQQHEVPGAASPAGAAAKAAPQSRAAKQHNEAIARLEAKVAANPADSHLHRDLSILYLRVGRLAEAKEQTRLAEGLRLRHATT